MTVGLMGSHLLCDCIQETLASGGDSMEEQRAAMDALPASFHTKLGALVDHPWAISTGPDAAYGPAKTAHFNCGMGFIMCTCHDLMFLWQAGIGRSAMLSRCCACITVCSPVIRMQCAQVAFNASTCGHRSPVSLTKVEGMPRQHWTQSTRMCISTFHICVSAEISTHTCTHTQMGMSLIVHVAVLIVSHLSLHVKASFSST